MFYVINLLDVDDLNQVHNYAASASFSDGSATAGKAAARTKRNQQVEGFDKSRAAGLIRKRLDENAKVRMAAIPARLSPLILSKYQGGMAYGLHTDNAIMQPNQFRSDLSFSIFLSDPLSYEGGELSVRTGDVERKFKFPAGQMLLYPSSTLHQVMPVTAGSRLAVVGWIQSLIGDAQRRAIVHDLSLAQAITRVKGDPNEADGLIAGATSNLLRLWATPST